MVLKNLIDIVDAERIQITCGSEDMIVVADAEKQERELRHLLSNYGEEDVEKTVEQMRASTVTDAKKKYGRYKVASVSIDAFTESICIYLEAPS